MKGESKVCICGCRDRLICEECGHDRESHVLRLCDACEQRSYERRVKEEVS